MAFFARSAGIDVSYCSCELKFSVGSSERVSIDGEAYLYSDGTWRILFTRPLLTSETEKDIQFQEGAFIPIAFATRDGSAGESNSRHTMTSWYWLMPEAPAGFRPYLIALIAVLLVIGLQYFWIRRARNATQDV